jgi:hypothetical protein
VSEPSPEAMLEILSEYGEGGRNDAAIYSFSWSISPDPDGVPVLVVKYRVFGATTVRRWRMVEL